MLGNVACCDLRDIPCKGVVGAVGEVRLVGQGGVAVPFRREDALSTERFEAPPQAPIPAKRSAKVKAGAGEEGASAPFLRARS